MPFNNTPENRKLGLKFAAGLFVMFLVTAVLVIRASVANAHEAVGHEANCEGVTGHFDFFPEGENEVTVTGTSASVVKTFTGESGSVSAHWEEIGGFTYSFSWEADGGGKAGPFEFDDTVCVPIEEEPEPTPTPTGECVLLAQVVGDVSYQYTAQLRLDEGATVTKATWSVDGHEVTEGISEDGNTLLVNPYDFNVGTHTVGFTADISTGEDKASNTSCFNSFTTPDVELTEILVPTPGETDEGIIPPATATQCPKDQVLDASSNNCILPVTGLGDFLLKIFIGIAAVSSGLLMVHWSRKRPELV